MFPPNWSVTEHMEHYLRQHPMLSELVDEYGVDQVWDVGHKVAGCPIFWDPPITNCLTLRRHLQER